MNYDDFSIVERVEVFGIPFDVIPVEAGGSDPKPQQFTTVHTIPDRNDLAIRFPCVVAYQERVDEDLTFDFGTEPTPIEITPVKEPTEVRMGVLGMERFLDEEYFLGLGDTITREEFHRAHRLQTTLFAVADEVTAGMPVTIEALRPLLFPRVLEAVERFVEDRGRVRVHPEACLEDLALQRYRTQLVNRVREAMRSSARKGVLLPVLDRRRPAGDTVIEPYNSTKPCFVTTRSHISHVPCDSDWERSFAQFLEGRPEVRAYVKNYRIGLAIPYLDKGVSRWYYPDFVVDMDAAAGGAIHWIVEVKGLTRETDYDKWSAAQRWVAAVNADGSWGRWRFVTIKGAWEFDRLLKEGSEELPVEV